MAGRLYALLVGINRYPAGVEPLSGCLNDVSAWEAYLRGSQAAPGLEIETLRDEQATRANLIHAFRTHLGQAGPDDVALFHYSGHGARWRSASAFAAAFPDGKDEGLVCVDSRQPGGYDLADKELAVLIDEVAGRGCHLVVVLDCCHAGSGTRSADAFRGLQARVTHEVFDERPLESYLDGHYAGLQSRGEPLVVPAARHVLLAACERTQQARETRDHQGVFTATLLEVLQKSGGATTYAELFVRCRDAVRLRADDQLPQFETFGHFDAWGGVLGRSVARPEQRLSVAFDDTAWYVAAGALHGISTDPERPATLTVYREPGNGNGNGGGDDAAAAAVGTARIVEVGAQRSEIRLDFAAGTDQRFRASLASLPSNPLFVWLAPGSVDPTALQAELDGGGSAGVAIAQVADSAQYDIVRHGADLQVVRHGSSQVIATVSPEPDPASDPASEPASEPALEPTTTTTQERALVGVLSHLAHWERIRTLANASSKILPGDVDWLCAEPPAELGGTETLHPGPEVVLDGWHLSEDGAAEVRAQLRVVNRSGQTLHFLLLHLSSDYGIETLYNQPLPPGDGSVTLYGDAPDDFFWVAGDELEAVDRFKLVVSTEAVDGFLFSCDPLSPSGVRAIGNTRKPARKFDRQAWTTRDLTVRTVRRIDELGPGDWSLPDGRLTVKGHPELTASISLRTLADGARGVGDDLPAFLPGFARAGLRPVGLVGGGRGEAGAVLELTNIQHADRLQTRPLELVLQVALAEDEGILPLVFDGEHVWLGGQPMRDAEGLSHVTIDRLPEIAAERRSLGGALKLYFFKTYLRRASVNLLRAVDRQWDGTVTRSTEGLAARVAGARRILLLVHGIIGDTDGMVEAVRSCGLDHRFDLVLSYDYENLSTPISATARQLDAALRGIGIGPDDGRHLTMLVHSMGGLVARWFIEREGGSATVDHLVMCGTPNLGSPFGDVGSARTVLTLLTGLAANAAPWLVPYTAPLLFILNRSAKLTPTLEQMAAGSEFMAGLNSSPHAAVRYTVLAGNVGDYHEPTDPLFARLLTRLGQGGAVDLLFGHRPNDIAVAVDSILSGALDRPGASSWPVACHHLNYFSSRAGQAALTGLDW